MALLDNIITPADQRILVDSKQNSGWTTRFVDPNTFITSIPPLDSATLTLSQTTESRQPLLENDLITFPDPSVDDQILTADGATMDYRESFKLALKFTFGTSSTDNQTILANYGAFQGNFHLFGRSSDGNIGMTVNGNSVKKSDGAGIKTVESWNPAGTPNYLVLTYDKANQTGIIKINGTKYENLILDGVDTNGGDLRLGALTFSPTLGFPMNGGSTIEYFVSAVGTATTEQVDDLDQFIRGSYSPWNPYKVQGNPLAGINVLYIIADDRNFTNATIHDIATTNASGEAPPATDIPTGKHLFVVPSYEVPDPAPSGLTIGDVYSEIGRWIDGFPT